ncbi:PhzF family phenazine biosynthesis isomerase [Xylophilus sp. GOD-11R]|uniref:PhzF family phenazine biosynthesis protein n=1 Tax=Xylophilus sp. GOD-11R TaxID=3089814 RepID=UPI00298BFFF7|nr:PhzF family phenazine biosynthesis isomerase [Xylophilus sp. GOD-11R]WPB56315.1 PhzF family phenazine biosynthesis isomerase [Xylophilus sp. GOD-11R]
MTEPTALSNPLSAPSPGELRSVDVFVGGIGGGNPVPFVADASAMGSQQMQDIARATGHESAFVLVPTTTADWRFRFFVPQHEMEMCGHATVGTLWALRAWGLWTRPSARIETLSGLVDAEWDAAGERVWISQPAVTTGALDLPARRRIADVVGWQGEPLPAMTNACTSRIKTLVPMPDVAALNALKPDFAAMEALCASIDSTGLYPFAHAADSTPDAPVVAARQFPKSSGYPEDAATGIAAAALWGHLAATGAVALGTAERPVVCTVRQGDAMGRPSAIEVRPRFDANGRPAGCWLSGQVAWSAHA